MVNSIVAARVFAATSALALLASCGGGGGSNGGGGSVQTNRAPQFTSPATASFVENTQGAIYTMGATDADGDSISFSITGGADQASFEVDGNMLVITFAPNFDQPNDVNGDNIFEVSIAATDGRGGRATRDLQLEVTNDREGIRVTRILSGLVDPVGISPTYVTFNEMVVALRDGSHFRFPGDRIDSEPVGPFSSFFPPTHDFVRLMDIAWASDNGFQGPSVMYEASFGYRVWWPESGFSRNATLSFGTRSGTEGRLYVENSGLALAALSDTSGEFARINSTSNDNRLGKIFQIVGCGASVGQICGEEIGLGIRSPGGFARYNDFIAFADQGGSVEHEMSLFQWDWRPLNFGWPYLEGSTVLEAGQPDPLVGPTLVYPVGDGRREGTGIVMGAGYTGSIPGIANHLVFGDTDGSIWSIPLELVDGEFLRFVDAMQLRNEDFTPDVGTLDSIVEIEADASGVLYILDTDGEVFRVDPA